MSLNKDAEMKQLVRDVVSMLLALDPSAHGEIVCEQCRRTAIELGNLMAPKIYSNGLHGVSNAISCAIRACSEALFWLDMSTEDTVEQTELVRRLHDHLSTPRCV